MSDNIDDVIQGILDRARQRKEKLSKMVSVKSDEQPSNDVGDHAEESNNEKLEIQESKHSNPFEITQKSGDLTADEPMVPSDFPIAEEQKSEEMSRSHETPLVKFESLDETLNSRQTTGVNVINSELLRLQKTDSNVDAPTTDLPMRQRGRLALASLASRYSKIDDGIFDDWCSSEVKVQNKEELKDAEKVGSTQIKDSGQVLRNCAKESAPIDNLCKLSANKNTEPIAKAPPTTKRWTTPTASAPVIAPKLITVLKQNHPNNDNQVDISSQTIAPSKMSVATTAKMFESLAAGSAPPKPATPLISTTKARAAFFNSLAAGTSPNKTPSNSLSSNLKNSVISAARAAFTSPSVSNVSPAINSTEKVVTMEIDMLETTPSTTYKATTKINLTPCPSPVRTLVPLPEEENSPEGKRSPRQKIIRRDSWEDSKTSMDEEDYIEEKKLGHDLVQPSNQNEEDEDNDADINDDDFENHDGSDDDDDESEDECVLSKPLNEDLNIMKDITNATSPSINTISKSPSKNTAELKESADGSPAKNDDENTLEVSMRKTTKRKSGSFKKPRGYISLYEYRQQQQSRPKSQPPPSKPRRVKVCDENLEQHMDNNSTSPYSGVVMRSKKLYPDLSGDIVTSPSQGSLGQSTIGQRIKELQDLINQELNIIHQTSNALNKCCHDLSTFAGSPEAVECHKLLLMACKKREAYVIEMEKFKSLKQPQSPYPADTSGPIGRLTISEVRLPMKNDFMSKLGTAEDTTAHYFLLTIRHNNTLLFSQMISTHEGQLQKKHHIRSRDYLEFPNLISLNNVKQNFHVDIEVYGMTITRTQAEPGTPRKSSKKALLTPRSSRKHESPAGPMSIRTTNFVHLASVHLNRDNVNLENFSLDKVPRSSPLQSCLSMNVRCIMENVIHKKDFLTMFEDVSGFGAWHRRWFSLKNGVLSYWKYPEDEQSKEPMGIIDLKSCTTAHVGLVTRESCARPNTFGLETSRKQKRGDRTTLVQTCDERAASITIKYWLSADTKEDRELWCNTLNEALMNVRAWHPEALKPISRA